MNHQKKRIMPRKRMTHRREMPDNAILRSLEDDRYRFRTVEGIARSLGVEADKVRKVLQSHDDTVVLLYRRSTNGREVYTTRKRYYQTASLSERLRSALINRIY